MSIEFRQHEPSKRLSWFVQYYWSLAGTASADDMHPIFPDGSPELVFNCGAIVRECMQYAHNATRVAQPKAMLVGQMTRAVTIEPSGTLDMLGVRLTPFGVAALFPIPATDLRDATHSLADLDAHQLRDLPELLQLVTSTADRIALLETRLALAMERAIHAITHASELHLRAIARALVVRRAASVDSWAAHLNCTSRTLQRHFDRYVGLTPKEFARIRRFQSALGLATDQPTLRWSTVAARTGYVDQSHLVRDFRQFAGAPPSAIRPTLTEISETFVDDTTQV